MLLTETHRPEVPSEQRRISEVGGFVNNKRVNGKIIFTVGKADFYQGVLQVTRALGDYCLKNLITSKPHTEHMKLTSEDTHVIIGSDGVRIQNFLILKF